MKDEEYLYVSDVIDKKITARSAMKRRTHTGKGGRVRFPSDNLTKKELQKMNGEVKTYRLNSPMDYAEFKSMPDDVQKLYIMALREKYNVPNSDIARMMGDGRTCLSNHLNRLGFPEAKAGRVKWDKEGFLAWANGVDMLPTPVIEEEPAEDPIQEPIISSEELEVFVEDDLPFEEPDPFQGELPVALHAEIDALKLRIDELLKVNEELMALHESDRQVIDKLGLMCSEYEQKAQMLEAQMDVVRLIFGGKNNG